MKRLNNLKIKASLIATIFIIESLSFELTSCNSKNDDVVIDYSAYNE